MKARRKRIGMTRSGIQVSKHGEIDSGLETARQKWRMLASELAEVFLDSMMVMARKYENHRGRRTARVEQTLEWR
jgi:hypothetical protein